MSVQDHANARLNAAMRRVKRQQEVLTSLAQQGIAWNDLKKAYMSVCYSDAALTLVHKHGATTSDIGSFIDRIGEITDAEISATDILDRAKEEASVDVGEIAKGQSTE